MLYCNSRGCNRYISVNSLGYRQGGAAYVVWVYNRMTEQKKLYIYDHYSCDCAVSRNVYHSRHCHNHSHHESEPDHVCDARYQEGSIQLHMMSVVIMVSALVHGTLGNSHDA